MGREREAWAGDGKQEEGNRYWKAKNFQIWYYYYWKINQKILLIAVSFDIFDSTNFL